MNNCDTDISGDCPAKHLVRSNLKLERSDSFTLAPKRSRLGVVRECRDAWSDRGILNARRSDAMATAVWGVTMRATSDRVLVCAKSGVSWGQSPLPVAPDAERETLYVQVFPTSARLFDTLITDYRS